MPKRVPTPAPRASRRSRSLGRCCPRSGGISLHNRLKAPVNARFVPSRRWGIASSVALAVVVGVIVVPGARTALLGAAGRALVVDDRIEPADIIVVTVDAGAAGLLEAADLVHGGTATRA